MISLGGFVSTLGVTIGLFGSGRIGLLDPRSNREGFDGQKECSYLSQHDNNLFKTNLPLDTREVKSGSQIQS